MPLSPQDYALGSRVRDPDGVEIDIKFRVVNADGGVILAGTKVDGGAVVLVDPADVANHYTAIQSLSADQKAARKAELEAELKTLQDQDVADRDKIAADQAELASLGDAGTPAGTATGDTGGTGGQQPPPPPSQATPGV